MDYIYLVILKERHSDVEVCPFLRQVEASDYAECLAKRYDLKYSKLTGNQLKEGIITLYNQDDGEDYVIIQRKKIGK